MSIYTEYVMGKSELRLVVHWEYVPLADRERFDPVVVINLREAAEALSADRTPERALECLRRGIDDGTVWANRVLAQIDAQTTPPKPPKPPKPDEPTKFGTKVRDSRGESVLLLADTSFRPWFGDDGKWRYWSQLGDDVEVVR